MFRIQLARMRGGCINRRWWRGVNLYLTSVGVLRAVLCMTVFGRVAGFATCCCVIESCGWLRS